MSRPAEKNSAGGEMEERDFSDLVRGQREFFSSGATRDPSFRIEQLERLKAGLEEHRARLLAALKADMGKPAFEAYLADIGQVKADIRLAVENLRSWMRPRRVHTPRFLFPARSSVRPEPLGVALIIGPWNYPVSLVLSPLVGALAAGNCAVLKPSEISGRSSRAVSDLISSTFDTRLVAAVQGGPDAATRLLEQRFDYIFYTGGANVGRIVMEAAARNVTPLTLELGGKSPCIVEPPVPLARAAGRIAWGKFFNAGQTCIAPDYLLVNARLKEDLIELLVREIRRMYGADASKSPDYARIVSDRHLTRLTRLLGSGRAVTGGEVRRQERYIAPTVLIDVGEDDPVMQEEIFGPVLPVIDYADISDAIAFVNSRPKPLALYIFTGDGGARRRVLRETTSGGACVNDVMMQFANARLPFGGVGASGFGRYHGRYSFETFSNMKSVVRKSFALDFYVRYPPYRRASGLAGRVVRRLF